MHLFIGTSSCGDLHTICNYYSKFYFLYYFDPFRFFIILVFSFYHFTNFIVQKSIIKHLAFNNSQM